MIIMAFLFNYLGLNLHPFLHLRIIITEAMNIDTLHKSFVFSFQPFFAYSLFYEARQQRTVTN